MGNNTPRTPIETEGSNGNDLPEGWEELLDGTSTEPTWTTENLDTIKPYFYEHYTDKVVADALYNDFERRYYYEYASFEGTNPNFDADWTKDNQTIQEAINKTGLNPDTHEIAMERAWASIPKDGGDLSGRGSIAYYQNNEEKENTQQDIIDFVASRQKENYLLLVRGALLACVKPDRTGYNGSHFRRINMPYSHGVYFKDCPVLHEKDCIVGDDQNIGSFGHCASQTPPTEDKTSLADYVPTDKDGNYLQKDPKTVSSGFKCIPDIYGYHWFNTTPDVLIAENSEAGMNLAKAMRQPDTLSDRLFMSLYEKAKNANADPAFLEAVTTNSFLYCTHGGIIIPLTSGQEPSIMNPIENDPLAGLTYGSQEYMDVAKANGINPNNVETDEYFEYASEQYDQIINEQNNLGPAPSPENENDYSKFNQWIDTKRNLQAQANTLYANSLKDMLETYGNYENIPEENKQKLDALKQKHDQINQTIFPEEENKQYNNQSVQKIWSLTKNVMETSRTPLKNTEKSWIENAGKYMTENPHCSLL